MNILDLVVGKPIRTSDERAEQIGPTQGIPIFGLDALSSAAYGPEAALSLLIPLGLLGVPYIVPISAAIITLLVIVYFSYRQTIAAYPNGGGSYTVARFNLGAPAGLLAAAALLADYILTAAVGISAGVGALISAVPSLLPHTVSLCLGILIVITILNLRGVREAGTAFAIPTYLFVGTLLITIVGGIVRVLLSGGHPTPAVPLPPPPPITEAVGFWLLLKVFASGCTALTGVEAVSNGVKAFKEPTVKNAQRTLTVIIFLLAILLAGISYLVRTYGIAATDPGQPGYQSILSMLTAAVFGKSFFYSGPSSLSSPYPPTPPSLIFPVSAVPSRRTITSRTSSDTAVAGSSTPTASWCWRLFVVASSSSSAALPTGSSRSMPSVPFWPLRCRKRAWSCTGGKSAARIG
jgi:amino acid transporter